MRFALVALCSLLSHSSAFAQDTSVGGTTSAAAMTTAAQRFLTALDDSARAKATMKYDDPARTDWHNIPKDARKGLQYRDMTKEQRELCHNLLRAALSKEGYAKAVNVMALESNLKEGEKGQAGTPLRDPERYFLTIFGKPDSAGAWGWGFEGHHLSVNFSLRDGKVIADTPSFWGSNPATVKVFVEGGPKVGVRNLAAEEQLAFDLVNSLSPENRKAAIIAEKAPDEYRAGGKPQPPQTAPEGIAATKLNEAQQKVLWSLLETYCNHHADDIARANFEKVKAEGLDRVYFAWAGATEPGVGHYYRVQGRNYLLEFINVQSDPAGNKANHIHSVWRNLQGDFGIAAH